MLSHGTSWDACRRLRKILAFKRSASISGVNRCQSGLNLIVGDSELGRLRRANKRSSEIEHNLSRKTCSNAFSGNKVGTKTSPGLRWPRVIRRRCFSMRRRCHGSTGNRRLPSLLGHPRRSRSRLGLGSRGGRRSLKCSGTNAKVHRSSSLARSSNTLLEAPRRTHSDNSCTDP